MPKTPYLFYQRNGIYRAQSDLASRTPDQAIELGEFILLWYKHFGLKKFLWDMQNDCECGEIPPSFAHLRKTFHVLRREGRCKLSMAFLCELDSVSVEKKYDLLKEIAGWLNHLHGIKDYVVGIDFSEVFFVEPGRALPAHYREGIDRIATSLAEYQQETSLFSYQVAKSFLGAVTTQNRPENPYGYAGWRHDQLHLFPNNDLTSFLELRYFLSCKRSETQIILRLGPPIALSDLADCRVDLIQCTALKEMIIFLSGEQYHTADSRQQVLHSLKQLVIKQKWRFFPHVFLLTDPDAVRCTYVHELATEHEEQAGFRALKQGCGYYLSDPSIFAEISHTIHHNTQNRAISLKDVFTETEPAKKPSQYIMRSTEPTGQYRKSKRFDAQQLKAHLSVSVTQQYALAQEVTQNQTLQQQETLNQDHTVTQIQQAQLTQQNGQHGFYAYRNTITVQAFFSMLQRHAMASHAHLDVHTKLLQDNHYFTAYHAKTDVLSRLAQDEAFLEKVTCVLFRRSLHNPHMIGLSQHSFIQMDALLVEDLLKQIEYLADGLDPDGLCLETGPYLYVILPLYRLPTLVGYRVRYEANARREKAGHFSLLALRSPQDFQPAIQAAALVHAEDLAGMEDEERAQWDHLIQDLLTLFAPECRPDLADEALFRQHIRALLHWHCPTADMVVLDALLASFPKLERDHAKIILWPIITGYRHKAEQFLNLLTQLEQRGLLVYFRRIYFEYAQTIGVVSDLLLDDYGCFDTLEIRIADHKYSRRSATKYKNQHLFLEIAQRIPLGFDPAAWPPFETFALHFLLYASKANVAIHAVDLKTLQKFWQRTDAALFRYLNGDRAETDRFMQLFVDKLISSENGLVVEPVCQAKTFFHGMEVLIDNAIRHERVLEQFHNWEGISLLDTDAVTAALYDYYTVVTRDMAVDITKLRTKCQKGDAYHVMDGVASSYRISAQELQRVLNDQCIVAEGYPSLTIKLFRYLGGQSLREPIHYYRHLLQYKMDQADPVYAYFRHLLLGHFVLTKTGAHYTRAIDFKILHQEFVAYLLQKNYILPNPDFTPEIFAHNRKEDPNKIMRAKIAGDYRDLIKTCVQDFYSGLRGIQDEDKQSHRYSLWYFYEKNLPPESKMASRLSWFWGQERPSFSTLPPVFKQPLSVLHLARFFLVHQEVLCQSSAIFDQYPHLLEGILVAQIRERFSETAAQKNHLVRQEILEEIKFDLYNWLKSTVSCRDIAQFIRGLADLETVINDFSELALEADYDVLRQPLEILFQQHHHLKIVLKILNMIAQQRLSEHYTAENMAAQLRALTQFPQLFEHLEHAEALLPLINTAYREHTDSAWLLPMLQLVPTLLKLDAGEASKTMQRLLTHIPWKQGLAAAPFFLQHPLSPQALQGLAGLLSDKSVDIKVLERIWQENSITDFSEASALFPIGDSELCSALCRIAQHVDGHSASILLSLVQCREHPKASVKLLVRLIALYPIDANRVLMMLNSANLKQELKSLEHDLHAENLDRFNYDITEIAQKIGKIRKKSLVDGEADQPLPADEQAQLLKDYQTMMSYMRDNPVFFEDCAPNVPRPLTIVQLNETQCQALYQQLSAKLQDATLSRQKKHAYRLVLVALSSEAHFRMTKKFPQDTQLLCELHASQIQEVKTGGGKSIISELRAVMLCAEGWTVDIATENVELADVALQKFKSFYEYLGVAHAKEIILPNSSRSAYVASGINHSTPSCLSFFRANMALKKKALPTHVALLCDEIDAALTTTIPNRLAGVLDPIYLEVSSWAYVFTELLAFVREEEVYLQNNCDDKDDVHNFITYFRQKQSDKKLLQFVEKIPEEVLDMLLNSARMPEALQPGVDYLAILREKLKKMQQYAAPILNVGTKRPEPGVSYSDGVQQLVHSDQNTHLARGELTYILEAITETLMIISAKNFFDFYPLVIGWTGSPGVKIELREFSRENGVTAHYYPVFHPDRSKNLGTHIVTTRAEQHQGVLDRIRRKRAQEPGKPIVIFVDSPKEVAALQLYVAEQTADLDVQSYAGYEYRGVSEKEIVKRAGEDNNITITTLSLSRGTDFETLYASGIAEINCAADITESEAIQTEGRVARNGHHGQFEHLICAEDLDATTAHVLDPAERFKAHQRIMTAKRQQERLKTRLLENLRYYVTTEYFLALRQDADRILAGQAGMFATTISEKTFLAALRDFHKQVENKYMQLLGTQAELDPAQQEAFMQYLVEIYQNSLTKMISDQDLQTFQAIEPMIALHHFSSMPLPEQLKLRELRAISDIFSSGWYAVGHQSMVKIWQTSDTVINELQPYFQGECTLKFATAQVLEHRQILQIPIVVAEIDKMKGTIEDFDWQDAVNGVQRGIGEREEMIARGIADMLGGIFTPDIIQKFKTFVLDYMEEVKINIADKKWDKLDLPNLQADWIRDWLSRIQLIWNTFALITFGASFVAGPIPFIVTRFVLPTLLSWLKTLVKSLFANSESEMVQVLIGLDDAFADISKVINLAYSKDMEALTIDELLNDVAPLFKNKAIQMIVTKVLSSTPDLGNSVFQLLPDLMQALEPYRHLKCTELKKPEIMMTILVKLLQSDLLKQRMDAEEHAVLIQRIQALPSGFSEIFKDGTLPQFMQVLQVLAHPRFNQFLAQMPDESAVYDLKVWLQADLDALPEAVQTPMRDLRDYQNNYERIAQEAQNAYRNIKQKYTLRIEDLKAHRSGSSRRVPLPEPFAPPVTFWRLLCQIQWVNLIISYTLLLIANYLLFGFGIPLVSGLFFVLVAVPMLYNMVTSVLRARRETFANDVIPPFVILATEPGELAKPALPLVTSRPKQARESHQTGAHQVFSLFGSNYSAGEVDAWRAVRFENTG
ncbi:MAG: hypothetical protein NTU48_06320 [Legionellales bacterium]|nr:hypothetical protein [Legionellales bacterium]